MSKELCLSVVIPVFNESSVIAELYRRTKAVLDKLENCTSELIFIDDGSMDDTVEKIERFAAADLVLPKARLGLVNGERTVGRTRGAVALRGQVLLVDAVAGFVEDAEERFVELPGVVARRQAAVAGADAGAGVSAGRHPDRKGNASRPREAPVSPRCHSCEHPGAGARDSLGRAGHRLRFGRAA